MCWTFVAVTALVVGVGDQSDRMEIGVVCWVTPRASGAFRILLFYGQYCCCTGAWDGVQGGWCHLRSAIGGLGFIGAFGRLEGSVPSISRGEIEGEGAGASFAIQVWCECGMRPFLPSPHMNRRAFMNAATCCGLLLQFA